MQEFIVDLSAVRSWEDFVEAFNEGFIRRIGGEWNGNLDAFNDYLFWPEEHPYRLLIRGWHAATPAVNQRKTWVGQPMQDVLLEIFRDNPQAQIVFDP